MDLAELSARAAITDALFRYCRGVDRMDRAVALSLWHPGGRADYTPWYDGDAEGLMDYLWEAHATLAAHAHQVHNVLIELHGDRAASEAYYTAVLRLETPSGRLIDRVVRGRYLDTWSWRDGAWGVEERRVVHDIESVTDARTSGKTDGGSRRDTADPSYAVFTNWRG